MIPKELDNLSEEESKKLLSTLEYIHSKVSDRFVYKADSLVWNKREHWENYEQIPDEGKIYGDCDCFAMACRKELRKLDLPSRLIFCLVSTTGHLVLECNGWILDNINSYVRANTSLAYTWVSMSGYERGDPWYIINPLP